jgi:glycosyltransferase involved in cell wall biosynthesis
MPPALSVITPVRDRPKGFALCERWMKRQTFTDYEWIVVDDGDHPIKPTMGQIYIRREPSKKPMTLSRNFTAGAKHISGAAVTLLEDDDWRGPNYLSGLMDALKSVDVAVTAGFYHYDVKYRLWKDERVRIPDPGDSVSSIPSVDAPPMVTLHAGFVGEAAEYFIEKMDTKKMNIGKMDGLDARSFWAYVWERFKVKLFDADMVAIKGITGRSWESSRHLQSGHVRRSLFPRNNVDPDGKILANLVGREDASLLLEASR